MQNDMHLWLTMNKLCVVLDTMMKKNEPLLLSGLFSHQDYQLKDLEKKIKEHVKTHDTFYTLSYAWSVDNTLLLQPKRGVWDQDIHISSQNVDFTSTDISSERTTKVIPSAIRSRLPKSGINLYMYLAGAYMKFVLYTRIEWAGDKNNENYSPTLMIYVTKTQNSDNFKIIQSERFALTDDLSSIPWLQSSDNFIDVIKTALCTQDAKFYMHLYIRRYNPDE